ncbi:aminotransferase class III-fold pyridoxal phosphate-dependent enzyme [Ensifer soli]|uniref:aminotransferase class III-fold pyridoxal phosphate-dependent enzyme n=1 Tax=Ciceribacter sp. sgz301302 TaxID=3342379 RepID=UPI0035B98419
MRHLVGQVSSLARVLPETTGETFVAARSAGPYLWGRDGRRYVDTSLGIGATILGHAHPAVVAAVRHALETNPSPAFAHDGEEQAAAALAGLSGPLSKIVFSNSGSEAVHLACRLARAVTGRRKIAKIGAGYDGWLGDILFGGAGAPDAAFDGAARPTNGTVTLLRYNDTADTERLFAEDDDIAAVIVEPLLANAGSIVPEPGYLLHLQETARRHGALVISDEVLMGMRLCAGLSAHHHGLDPDIATLGKAIASGFPVGAVAGKPAVMAALEDGRVARFGTFSGNPMAAAAVTATLAVLKDCDYPALTARGDALRRDIARGFSQHGADISTSGHGTVFSLWFAPRPPTTYEEAARLADASLSAALHAELRRAGALVLPSPFGRMYIGFTHDEEALGQLTAAFASAARGMAPRLAGR